VCREPRRIVSRMIVPFRWSGSGDRVPVPPAAADAAEPLADGRSVEPLGDGEVADPQATAAKKTKQLDASTHGAESLPRKDIDLILFDRVPGLERLSM
jgi:hypothetical protein